MAIDFTCNQCGNVLRVKDEHLGKKARCPACKAIVLVQPISDQDSINDDFDPFQSSNDPYGDSSRDLDTASPNPYAAAEPSVPQYNPYLPVSPTGSRSSSRRMEPHRGVLVLSLGVASIFTCIFPVFCCLFMIPGLAPGVAAGIIGVIDLKKMEAGEMDPAGKAMTMAGMVLGITFASLSFIASFLVLYIGFAADL